MEILLEDVQICKHIWEGSWLFYRQCSVSVCLCDVALFSIASLLYPFPFSTFPPKWTQDGNNFIREWMHIMHLYWIQEKKRLETVQLRKPKQSDEKTNAKNIHIKMNNKTTPIITITMTKKMDVPANRVVYKATHTHTLTSLWLDAEGTLILRTEFKWR